MNCVTVKECFCSPDIELLVVGMRPYYLPQEIMYGIAVSVYIPLSADGEAACDVIHSIEAKLQTQQPNTFVVINGDFNRDNETLDLLYANVNEVYSASAPDKPWIITDLKGLLNKKKHAFTSGDRQKLRSI